MSRIPGISWTRILAEGAIIVVSILLAFWIDAWWQDRIDKRQSEALIRGLQSDFAASQVHLSEWLAGNRKAFAAARKFLAEMMGAPIGVEIEVPFEWVIASVTTPTYDPTDTSLRTAVATGQIALITDQELRDSLAIWRQQLEDTKEDEILAREIVVNQLVPILSRQARLGEALEFDPIINWFTGRQPVELTGTIRIRVSSELEGALAQKLIYARFIVDGLAAIGETQEIVLEHLALNL